MKRFLNKIAAVAAMRTYRSREFSKVWVEEYDGQYNLSYIVKARCGPCVYVLDEFNSWAQIT
jgi:hypothetical protein